MSIAVGCARLLLVVSLACAGGGCEVAYLVKRSELQSAAMLPQAQRPEAVPAEREEGRAVLLKVGALVDDPTFVRARALGTQAGVHFQLAAELAAAGQPGRAAVHLRSCLGLRNDTEDRSEIEEAIARLEAGDAAGVPIGSLRVAASYRTEAAPIGPESITVTPRNRAGRAAAALAIVGGVLALGGVAGLASVAAPCNGDLCHMGSFIGGGVGMGLGTMFFITSAITGLAGRRSGETSEAALKRRHPELLDPFQLARETATARRVALGGGITAALSVALVLGGAGIVGGIAKCESCPGRLRTDVSAAGIAALSIGAAALLPAVITFAVGMARWKKLGSIARGEF